MLQNTIKANISMYVYVVLYFSQYMHIKGCIEGSPVLILSINYRLATNCNSAKNGYF